MRRSRGESTAGSVVVFAATTRARAFGSGVRGPGQIPGKGGSVIRVFKSPVGAKELRELQQRIMASGWQILGVKRSETEKVWLIRCANKEWFLSLPYEKQVRVAQGRPAE